MVFRLPRRRRLAGIGQVWHHHASTTKLDAVSGVQLAAPALLPAPVHRYRTTLDQALAFTAAAHEPAPLEKLIQADGRCGLFHRLSGLFHYTSLMLTSSAAGFRRLLPFLGQHWRPLAAGSGCTIVYVATFPLLAAVAGRMIPAIGSGSMDAVLRTVAMALGLFLVQKLAQFGQDALLAGPSLRVSEKLRRDLFAHLQQVSWASLETLSSGDITYRLTEDADRVGEVVYKTVHDSLPSLLQLVAVLAFMVWLDPLLTLYTLLLTPFVVLLVSWFGTQVLRASEQSQTRVSQLAALLAEAVGELRLVRAFACEAWLQKRFNREVARHRRASFRTLNWLALQHPVVGFIEAAGILAVLLLGAMRISSGSINAQQFSSYATALVMLIDPISHLVTNFNTFQQGQASLRRLRALEQEPLEPRDPPEPVSLGPLRGEVAFEDVQFGHDPAQPLFRGLNLQIRPGQHVALVGPSGSGKSTLVSLLLRFHWVQQGRILLDGKDLRQLRAADLRRQVALVPQNAQLLSGTIAEAIDFGRGYSPWIIRKAAQLANAEDFILAMGGYGTRIEEQSRNLSGGQRQRLAIARAVVGDPALLLLDEATSALDAEAEAAVQRGLKLAMEGRTVFVIAHRLATVQEADLILLLDQGEIVERGSHSELMARAGRYEALCRKQLIRDC